MGACYRALVFEPIHLRGGTGSIYEEVLVESSPLPFIVTLFSGVTQASSAALLIQLPQNNMIFALTVQEGRTVCFCWTLSIYPAALHLHSSRRCFAVCTGLDLYIKPSLNGTWPDGWYTSWKVAQPPRTVHFARRTATRQAVAAVAVVGR